MDNETRRKILEAMVAFNNAMTEALGAQEVQVPRVEEQAQSPRVDNPKSVEPQELSVADRIIEAMKGRSYPIKAKTIARLAGSTEYSVQHHIVKLRSRGVPIITVRKRGYILGHLPARYNVSS